MRILLLENVSEIGLPQAPPTPEPDGTSAPDKTDNHTSKVYNWNVAGINSWGTSEQRYPTNHQHCFDSSRLQLLLQDKRTFAVLDAATLQLHPLEGTTTIAEDCAAISLSSDGKLVFGLQWSEDFVVLCHPDQDVKHIRNGYGMMLGKTNKLYKRIVSRVQGLFGTTSGSSLGENENKIDPIDTLFPLLTPSEDGLALLCFSKPGEGFLFTCNYSAALRHKQISNIVGSKVPGRWWKITTDQDIVQDWARDKGLPSVQTKLCFLEKENESRSIQGMVVYSAFANQRLEMLYGMLAMNDNGHYELQWGLLSFEVDLVVPDVYKNINSAHESLIWSEETNLKDENPHFVMKVNSKGDKVAIAVNTHAGVYVHIQDLPGAISDIKLERVPVPLCSHCDYGNAIYYDRECWVSCLEWVADDCYLAVSTRCGCLSFFHKTGEPIITKEVDNGQLVKERCDFYTPIFNGRGPINTPKQTSIPLPPEHPTIEINLKWCGPGTNVLAISNGSKVYVERILRVSNYMELSDVRIPSALSFARSLTSNDIKSRPKSKHNSHDRLSSTVRFQADKVFNNNGAGLTNFQSNFETGEQVNSKIYAFVKDLPQAEIILRPVIVQTSSSTDNRPQSRNRPVEFKFPNPSSTTVMSVETVQFPPKEAVWKVERHQETTEDSKTELENLNVDFELVHRNSTPRNYYADDEGTEHSDDKPEFRPESSNRSEWTATDIESCKPEESDVASLADSTYSPPFTDQEDDDADDSLKGINGSKTSIQSPQFIRLTLPQSPKIEGVIPFAPINLTDDPQFIGKTLPSVRPTTSRSRSPNTTALVEDSHGEKSLCIITADPSPKPLDQKFCIMSPMLKLQIPSEENFDEVQNTYYEDDGRILNELHEEEYKPSDENDEQDILHVDEDNNVESTQEEKKSPREIWEEVSGMFLNMKSPSRNPKRDASSNTASATKLKSALSKSRLKSSLQPTDGSPPRKSSVHRSVCFGSFSYFGENQTKTPLEQFFGKIAPARASKDDLLDYLKNKLVSESASANWTSHLATKPKKSVTKISGEVNQLPKSPKKSNSMVTANVAKELRQPPATNKNKKLRAESQPNFLKPTSSSALKKSNVSEPHLNKALKSSPSATPSQSPRPKTSVPSQLKSKTPPEVKKPVLCEFTVSTKNTNAPVRPKAKTPKPKQDIPTKVSEKKPEQNRKPQIDPNKNRRNAPTFNNLTLGPQNYIDKSFAAFAKKYKSAFLDSQREESNSSSGSSSGQRRSLNIPSSSSKSNTTHF